MNMNAEFLMYAAINIGLALIISPFFMGLIKKVKALCQRRKGPSLLQPYWNLLKLFKKEVIVSKDSSWITRTTPYINIAVMLVAVLFVPFVFVPDTTSATLSVFGNVILLLYLFALAKFLMALTGLDAGSTFGGMGSSREMAFSAILEPVTITVFLALAFIFKTANLFSIFKEISLTGLLSINPQLILLAASFFIILIGETSRIPVDNPETHLELTMIHEAMLLEQSGKNLALMELSNAIKQTILMAIFLNVFLPAGPATQLAPVLIIAAVAIFLVKGIVLSIFIGLFESYFAKLRLFRLPVFFVIPFFLAFLTIIVEVFI